MNKDLLKRVGLRMLRAFASGWAVSVVAVPVLTGFDFLSLKVWFIALAVAAFNAIILGLDKLIRDYSAEE